MKKYMIFFLMILFSITIITMGCPPADSNNGEETPEPTPGEDETPTPSPATEPTPTGASNTIYIDDFESYTDGFPPGGEWLYGDVTTYEGEEMGVVVKNYFGSNALTLMDDQLGEPETYGVGEQGYTYAQITFVAPTAGTLYFEYLHFGYVDWPDPSGELQFWKDLDIADIASPPAADWIHNTPAAEEWAVAGCSIDSAGTYRLTWKAVKGWDDQEDVAQIDNIRFEY